MLTTLKPEEDLYMYLLVSEHAVSTMLLRDQGVQQPIYYISKTLVDAETRYLPLEKLVLALVHATRKLPHYFQAYTIYILIEYPLQSLLKRYDFTGRIAKWGTRLGFFDIRYRPESSMKGQVLADFVANFSSRRGDGDSLPCRGNPVEGIYRQCIQRIRSWGWNRSHHPIRSILLGKALRFPITKPSMRLCLLD